MKTNQTNYKKINITFPNCTSITSQGFVSAINGSIITAKLDYARIKDACEIVTSKGIIMAEIVAFSDNVVKLAPLASTETIQIGCPVKNLGHPLLIKTPEKLLGKVIDVLGNELSIDQCSKNPHLPKRIFSLNNTPPKILTKKKIDQQLLTGVRAIDAFCPIGYGQRLGLLAGAGVGKSTLLGMIARNATVDVIVIALVGERSREVPEFISDVLGEDGLKKSVVVVATSDESAGRRALAPQTATTIAEVFREQGKRVLLLVDSLTRTARAYREIGLATGELPVRQGFPASVYSELPKLLERAGTDKNGSITAIYTILTQTDLKQDALADELKSLLDGHIILEPKLAEKGIFPAFDITTSISRLQDKLLSLEELQHLKTLKAAASNLKHNKDMLLFGGVADPELKAAMTIEKELFDFIAQSPYESPFSKELIAKTCQHLTKKMQDCTN